MLDPDLILKMRRAAEKYGDDPFFAVWMKDHWLVFNWTLGLAFYDREIMNCPHFDTLRERVDEIFDSQPQKERDILDNLIESQNWLDMFAGRAGIYMTVDEVDMAPDERCIFPKGWPVMGWSADSGQRYYMKSDYFTIVEEAVGEDSLVVNIYKPITDDVSPSGYRPFIFQDDQARLRGILMSTMLTAPEDHRSRHRRQRARI